MKKSSIACTIVTYNRRNDLEACLRSCLDSERPFDKIIVFNCASTDGTNEFMLEFSANNPTVEYIAHDKNVGGSGGWAEMLKRYHGKYDYFYIIDDDVFVEPDTVAKLEKAAGRLGDFGFLSSLTLDYSDRTVSPMNFPNLAPARMKNPEHIRSGYLEIATGSFVGMFLPGSTVAKVGYPMRQFFIYGDDYEYSLRISKLLPCYLIGDSIVLHKGKSVDFCDTPPSGLWKHYYATRNLFYTYRKHRNLVLYFGDRMIVLVRALRKNKLKSWPYISTIFRGMAAGIMFHPKVERLD